MTSSPRMRFAGAIAAAAIVAAVVAPSAVAQEYLGSTITVGGGASSIDVGDIIVLAPGVTISGGDVTNETGIGVIIDGGSSIGSVTGGGTNASITE
jgi:uncharacterized protein YggE